MPYPGQKPMPGDNPGIPNTWDDYINEPYNPNDPETPPGGGASTGPCPDPSTFPADVDSSGNRKPADAADCINAAESARRNALYNQRIGDTGQPKNPTQGTGGGAPKPSGPVPPYNPGYKFAPVPEFGGLPDFEGPKFTAPSFEDAMNDPGYKFAVDEGRRARDASAASRGSLRTGAQARSLDAYGQAMGAQQYSNVYGRRFGEHDQAYRQAFGEYGQRYRQALDMYSPKLAEWTMLSSAEQRAKDIANQNQFGQWYANNLTAAQLMSLLSGI